MVTLLELRTRAGLTRRDLGERLGVSHMAIYYWETGKRGIGAEQLRAIARYFGVSMDDIALPGEDTAGGTNHE